MAIKKPTIRRPLPPVQLPPREKPVEIPEGELPPIEPMGDIFSLLSDLYPEYGTARWQSPIEREKILDLLVTQAQEEPDVFLQDLYKRDGTGRGEQLLRMMGVAPEEITAISTQFEDIEATVTAVFPDLTPDELLDFATESWGSFLLDISEKGDTKETRDLLELMGFNQSDINDLFQLPPTNLSQLPIGSYKITDFSFDDISKFAMKDSLSFERALTFEGRTPETMEILEQLYGVEYVTDERLLEILFEKNTAEKFISGEWLPDALEDYWGAFWSGAYDLISISGSIADRLGNESVAGNLKKIGLAGHDIMPDIDAKPGSPQWYALNLTRMVPMLLGLIGTTLVTANASTEIVIAAGGGKLLQTIVPIIVAGATSSVGEGALEAGDAYQTALDRGYSQEESNAVFDKVFRNNVGLLSVTNTAQFGLTFFLPGGNTARLIVKGLIFGFDAASEGFEEGAQLAITREALGDPQEFDEEMWQNVTLGLAGGLGFAGVGAVYTNIQSRIDGKMTDEQRGIFQRDTGDGVAQGLSRQEAEAKAYDNLAETPEGEAIITEATNEIMNQELAQNVEEGKKAAESIEPVLKGIEADTARVNELVEETIAPEVVEEVPAVPEVIEIAYQVRQLPIPFRGTGQEITQHLQSAIIERLGTDPTITLYRGFREGGKPLLKPLVEPSPTEVGAFWTADIETAKTYGETLYKVDVKASELADSRLTDIVGGIGEEFHLTPELQRRAELVTPPAVEVAKPPVEPEVPIEADNSGIDITKSADIVVAEVPIINEITVIERGRPTRKVFDKMGIYDIWESAFKQETLKSEELTRFNKVKKEHAKTVGRDAARRELLWEYVNNNRTELYNQMSVPEKRAARWFKEFADSWADRLGIPQDQRIKNYISHIFDEQAKVDVDIPVNAAMAQMLDSTVREKVPMPFLKKRLGKEFGLIKDPFMAATAYENMALKIFYYQPLLEKIKLIAEHESTPEFAGKYLKDFSRRLTGEPHTIDREINAFINQVAGSIRGLPGGTRLADALSQGNPAGLSAYNLTSAMYVMWLGFKPTSAIRNLSQQGLVIAEAGPVAFAEGYTKTLTVESKQAASESLVIRSRRGAFVESIDSTMIEGLPAKFREAALFLFRQADALNVRQAFLAGYYQAKRQYPTADRSYWIKRGDEVAMDTQYLYTKLNSIAISQSGPGKVGAMLTTWAINYSELINKWVQGKESRVYLDLVKTSEGRFEMPSQNWVMRRKALWTYLAIIGLLYGLKEQDWNRLKVWEYSGLTSLKTFANLIGGEFPALELPGAVANIVAGALLDDDRRLKTGWNKIKRAVSVLNQLEAVAGGEKDWMTLLFYLKAQNFRITELKEEWEKDFQPYEDLSDLLIRGEKYPTLSKTQAQNKYREENPVFEAQKFIVGDFTKLTTDEARAEVLRLIEKHNLNPDNINGYAKIFSADINAELQKFKNRVGNLESLVIGEEAKYFTISSYVSEVNRLVKKHGMTAVASNASPLTKFILEEQTSWKWYDDFTTEGRVLVRQQNPELEASLYLVGKVQAFQNPKSAEILLGLMKKYDIPSEAIPAFIEDPSRYDELFTQKFELEQKWFDQTTEYENFGNTEAPNYIEDKEERKLARTKFKEDNPDWVADMRRIEAIDNDASDVVIERWVERGVAIDEFGASSSQAILWLVDNPDTYDWAVENELLVDNHEEYKAREPVLRINVDWAKQDDAYNAIQYRDKRVQEDKRKEYLLANVEYAKKRRQRDALQLRHPDNYFRKFPDGLAGTYVDYYMIPEKPDDWLEGVGYYEDNWFLQEHPELLNALVDFGILEKQDFSKVPPRDIFPKLWIYEKMLLEKKPQRDLDTYRLENEGFDKWGVSIGRWKETMTEQRRRKRITPTERFLEDVIEKETEFDKAMRELEELLKGLR